MRTRDTLAAVTNVVIIAAVAFTLFRPSGAVGAVVVSKYHALMRQRLAAREWPSIIRSRRVDANQTPVAFVEFADYECPACRRQYPSLHAALNKPNAGGLVFRHRPLPIHTHAEGAARSAICAERQGRFAAMHDRLFTTDTWMADTNWMREAVAAGVPDTAAFRSCLSSEETTRELQADMALADSLIINATPTFIAEHEVRVGIIPDTTFLRVSRETAR